MFLDETTHTYFDPKRPDIRWVSVSALTKYFYPDFAEMEKAEKSVRKKNKKEGVKMTEDEVQLATIELAQSWEDNRNKAANWGTWVHKVMENHVLHGEVEEGGEDFVNSGKKYYEGVVIDDLLVEEIVYFSPEYVWGDIPMKVSCCGTLDLGVKSRHTMYDWKTNKKIASDNWFGEYMLGYFEGYPNCELYRYTISCNLYRIMANHCGYDIREMMLLHWRKRPKGWKEIPLSVWDIEKVVLKEFRKREFAKYVKAKHNPITMDDVFDTVSSTSDDIVHAMSSIIGKSRLTKIICNQLCIDMQ